MSEDNENIGEIIMEGLIVKSPPLERIKKFVSWHKRYMVLLKVRGKNLKNVEAKKGGSLKKKEKLSISYCLVYWSSEKDRRKREKPIRTIIILKTHAVVIQRESPHFADKFPYVFAFITSERIFYFHAENESKQQEWYQNINQAIQSTDSKIIDDHMYESIFEVLRTKKEYKKNLGLTESSTEQYVRRDSSDSKDSGSFDTSHSGNEDDYQTMHAAVIERSFSALPQQKPKDLKLRRKISVPLPSRRFEESEQFSPTVGPIGTMRPISREVGDLDIERAKNILQQRKLSVPTSLLVRDRTASDRSSTSLTVVEVDDDSHCNDTESKEPMYYELEEMQKSVLDQEGITFYNVKIDVPTNARIKMSENELVIITDKVTGTLRFTKK